MTATTFTQTFLVERDVGLLCRILGLYAARGIDVESVGYRYAARGVMKLDVSVRSSGEDLADTLRVLVDKASTFFGVIVACEQEAIGRRVA